MSKTDEQVIKELNEVDRIRCKVLDKWAGISGKMADDIAEFAFRMGAIELSKLNTLADNISTAGYVDGNASGLKRAANNLRTQAGGAFVVGEDEKAKLLRDLADEMDRASEKELEIYESTYRQKKERAFSEIERMIEMQQKGYRQ